MATTSLRQRSLTGYGGPASLANRTVLFLDIDDVICKNSPYGGYDVAMAFSGVSSSGVASLKRHAELWQTLFDADACSYLRALYNEFCPVYVLSTSWWWLLDDDALREVLIRTGLGFVVDNLHSDMATPKGSRPNLRWTEIKAWLDAHAEFAGNWVVLDDHLSGTGLFAGQPEERRPYIVLCSEGVGLTEREYLQLRAAFQLRSVKHARSTHDDTK
ncbi:HAD domain-containing protein [Variovorax sp. J22R24]|uniref:HAD domain-containing protein n=1 Tax=Variovorax gracilis TaxID=3053502 RepID=UPI0025773358|nr:HAD domain-containing protein [Variovorax sp. J22R24]MDM0108657.1 HAD domain-containing protein [Variovorax sp. J22R24]